MSRLRKITLALGLLAALFASRVSAVAIDNLLTNPYFDTDLSGWTYNSAHVSWNHLDFLGQATSGSALLVNSFTDGSGPALTSSCVLLPASASFNFGSRFFIPSGQGQAGTAHVFLNWFSSADCSGASIASNELSSNPAAPVDSWITLSKNLVSTPAGAISAYVRLVVFKGIASGPNFSAYADNPFFRESSCGVDPYTLCLHGGRFRSRANWQSTTDGGRAFAVSFNDDSGYFYFFSPNNTEVVVKVVSACVAPFDSYWVFAAGLTNVLTTLSVEDTTTGLSNQYINPQGTPFAPIQDTSAFSTCP